MLRLVLPSVLGAMEGSIYLHIEMSWQRPLLVLGILFALQNHLNLVVPSPGAEYDFYPHDESHVSSAALQTTCLLQPGCVQCS